LPASHELGLKVLSNLNKDTIQVAFCQDEISDIDKPKMNKGRRIMRIFWLINLRAERPLLVFTAQ
jgi:hypothetical protein